MEKVSIIIPTYNRFEQLLNTIKSVKEQTYTNLEIIVINDCSSEKEYYEYDWKKDAIIIIHLKESSRTKFGYACTGFVRNRGIEIANGKYIAFCDDDDIWFPKKLELQLNAMKESRCKMSSTDGLIGNGIYNPIKTYKKYNAEHNYNTLQNIYKQRKNNLLINGFPKIWNLEFLKIHNCIVTSSVLIEKEVLTKINNFKNMRPPEDYDCWLRVLNHTNCVYLEEICFYYNLNHHDSVFGS